MTIFPNPPRRAFAVAALVCIVAGAPAAGRPADVDAPAQTIRIISSPFDVSMGATYAQELGFFKQAGITAHIDYLINGEAAESAVIGGSAEIGIANTMSFAIGHEKGLPLVFIAPGAIYRDSDPTTVLVVSKTSPIQRAADLRGKTIALPALSGLPPISVEAWLDKNGADPASVKFIEMPIAAMGAAVQEGRVDAALIAEPGLTAALQHNDVRVLGRPFGAIADRFYIDSWYANASWVQTHRDLAVRVAKAIVAAELWANEHPDESAKILMKVTKISPALLSTMRRATFTAAFEPALLQPVIDVTARYKGIQKPFPAGDLYVAL